MPISVSNSLSKPSGGGGGTSIIVPGTTVVGNLVTWGNTAGGELLDSGTQISALPKSLIGTGAIPDFDHFIGPLDTTAWSAGGSCAINNSLGNTPNKVVGVLQMQTGGSSSGQASLIRGPNGDNAHWIGNQTRRRIEWRVQIPALSDGTERFEIQIGAGNVVGGSQHNHGLYFRYNDSISTEFQTITRQNDSQTPGPGTGVTVTAGQWYTLMIEDVPGTVMFYIDGVLVGTHTTNLPNSSSTRWAPGAKIVKSIGTTTRMLYVDYFAMITEIA